MDPTKAGLLVMNADDWGRDRETTQRTLDCVTIGAVSSVSAMVFMEDSERAAAIACDEGIDAGLHLNFTTPFSRGSPKLVRYQEDIGQYLLSHRLAQAIYHPRLARAFECLVAAQLEEFARLYGSPPTRIDGHHHMHLCANVLFGKLLPARTIVRRNFSFERGEKSWGNRMYRRAVDHILVGRHQVADYFFSLLPLNPQRRLDRIFALARTSVVEVETHPVIAEEYNFLNSREFFRQRDCLIPARFQLTLHGNT